MAEPITRICSRTVVLPLVDIDTDQILPARFLMTTGHARAAHAFADWRARGDCPLDREAAAGAAILVAGANFGCGSAREHAVWALVDFGIRAVVSTRIADYFRANAEKNGLLPVEIDRDTHAWLLAHPGCEIAIDLASQELLIAGREPVAFPIDAFAKQCLMRGVDRLGWLLDRQAAIAAFEATRRPAE